MEPAKRQWQSVRCFVANLPDLTTYTAGWGEVEWGGTGGGAGQAACTQASGAQQRGWQAWMEATGSRNNARHVPHTATHVFVMLPGFHAAKHT